MAILSIQFGIETTPTKLMPRQNDVLTDLYRMYMTHVTVAQIQRGPQTCRRRILGWTWQDASSWCGKNIALCKALAADSGLHALLSTPGGRCDLSLSYVVGTCRPQETVTRLAEMILEGAHNWKAFDCIDGMYLQGSHITGG